MFYTKPTKSLEHSNGLAYSPLNSAMLSCSCKARKALEWSTYLAVCWIKKIQLRGWDTPEWIFGPQSFITLKDSHQDLSNEGQTLFWVH